MNRCLIGRLLPGAGLVLVLAWVLALLFGCGAAEKNDYLVLFGEPVSILDETIYDNGTPIGKVTETEIGPGNKSMARVKLDSEFASPLAQNHVFILKSGQLCLTRIAPFGEPLEANAAILGFASKMELYLFRLKNLFSDKITAARSQTEKLAHW